MNRSYKGNTSHKKNKASGYRKFTKTSKGRKIIQMKRKKGRKIF